MPSAKHKKKKDDAPASTSLSAFTDLIIAIELGDEGKVTRLLKQSKEIVDGPADATNVTRIPVFKAIACQQVGCLRLLIDAGAEVNLQDRGGVSPLMEACKADDTARSAEMVRQLEFDFSSTAIALATWARIERKWEVRGSLISSKECRLRWAHLDRFMALHAGETPSQEV